MAPTVLVRVTVVRLVEPRTHPGEDISFTSTLSPPGAVSVGDDDEEDISFTSTLGPPGAVSVGDDDDKLEDIDGIDDNHHDYDDEDDDSDDDDDIDSSPHNTPLGSEPSRETGKAAEVATSRAKTSGKGKAKTDGRSLTKSAGIGKRSALKGTHAMKCMST